MNVVTPGYEYMHHPLFHDERRDVFPTVLQSKVIYSFKCLHCRHIGRTIYYNLKPGIKQLL